MTAETEVVKARFGADPDVDTAAAMTTDTRVGSAPIDEVVMTLNAVHRAMFVVRKSQDERLTTAQERFTQRQSRVSAQQCKQRDQQGQHNGQYEPRVPSENQTSAEMRRRPGRLSPRARAQQRDQHDAR
jgi:hypothetical protein